MAKKLVIFAGNNTLWGGTPPVRREGASEVLCGLRCERTLVIAGDPLEQARVLGAVGLEHYFVSRWFCGTDPDTKRATLRQLMRDATRELGATAKDVVCVGDNPMSELLAASKLKMTTVYIPPPEGATPEFGAFQPDHRISDLRELLALV